jgi:hypothetical protein
MKNGKQTTAKQNGKPKYSIHDFKPKKRYTRAEKEKIKATMEFLEALGKEIEKNKQNEQTEETALG